MHPAQIKHACNLANEMIIRHRFIKIESVEELLLIPLQPTHHRKAPVIPASGRRNHCSQENSTRVLQHNRPNCDTNFALANVRFRNGPLCVKSTNQSFATELLLPSVVDKMAATLCMSERIRSANL